MPRRKLYLFILCFALAGYSWIILNQYFLNAGKPTVNVCIFRWMTGIPCPSCGTTHSLLSILRGDFQKAFSENSLGFPAALMLFFFPLWILSDLLLKKESFYRFYKKTELILRKRWIAYPAILLFLANWGWNVYRHFS
jgi:hypothetical protein